MTQYNVSNIERGVYMALIKPCKIKIDLYNTFCERVPEYTQYDRNIPLEVTVTAKGEETDITEWRARIGVSKPDGTRVYREDLTVEGNVIKTRLTEQVFAVAGMVEIAIDLVDEESTKVSLHRFYINVKPSVITDEVIKSSNDYQTIVNLIKEVRDIETTFEQEQRDRAEAFEEETSERGKEWQGKKGEYDAEFRLQMNSQRDAFNQSQSDRTRAFNQQMETQQATFEVEESERNRVEQTRRQQEQARETAEVKRETAEGKRQTAETERMSKETEREQAEVSRVNAEAQRKLDEGVRQTSEDKRKVNEVNRQSAEEERVTAEANRKNVENDRVTKESQRQIAESNRTTAETQRNKTEQIRQTKEVERQSTEQTRQTKEQERQVKEQERITAEQGRIDAETERNERMTEFESRAEQMAVDLEIQTQRIEEYVNTNEERLIDSNDKVDYMGNQHESLKAKNDADVDWLLGEINTAHYEGQQITATNTLEGRSKSAILSGQTLVNLMVDYQEEKAVQYGNPPKTPNVANMTMLKPNTEYTLFYKAKYQKDGDVGKLLFRFAIDGSTISDIGVDGTNPYTTTYQQYVHKFTTPSTIDYFVFRSNGHYFLVKECVLIEGDYTNIDIPYFEGMQSVKMPVLTTTGKNLYPDGDLTINNPRASVWYYTNGVGSKFGQHCKRGDGGNWFYLAKGTYTYKATTKNTLTNIVLIGESENVCTSGSTLESGWYVFRFKTGSESVDYAKVSNIQIELGSIATPYEPYKSNILTTTSKNLFDMNRPHDNLTDSQATVVQGTNQITVSSAESGAYVSANFILNKDFFAGKTVTGSCLYESDEKGIGTVQITYQDGNGEHHYQWIKTPRTFTFPNSFIGDVMLSISANNTDTPQSNTITVKNIQLELGSTATPYEPHSEVTLRGIGDVKDELDCLTGEVTERIGEIVLNGNESWKLRATTTDVLVFNVDDVGINSFTDFTNSHKKMLCDKFVCGYYENNNVEFTCCKANGKGLLIGVLKSKLATQDVDGLKAWLSSNNVTVQYQLATESVKTVDLSDNHVYSYKDTTHYACSSEDSSLVPSLSIDVPTNLPALVSSQRETIKGQENKISDLQVENELLKQSQGTQDSEIITNMLASVELFEMVLGTMPNTVNTSESKGVNPMIEVYVTLILKGEKTIEQVPMIIRDKVQQQLDLLTK